ncbi:hypothetical protein KY290_000107 [Solanum tuberosum]|uniref:Uncharacterized protein n=1 Tax=Solanum tuberosum TaxID=4113 RepID=A0ABQ7WKF2_SOLTU|nr:hypothetical protein KY290_000107 [Solanum tuberosum]
MSNVSMCTDLLHLAPNSPDAKVFQDFAKAKGSSAAPSAPAVPATPAPPTPKVKVHLFIQEISGKLGIGSITELEGIEVKRFLFWFNVKEIRVDLPLSDSVYFQIGLVNKKLDIHQFETIHSCMKNGSLRQVLQLPAPVNDMQMLITE